MQRAALAPVLCLAALASSCANMQLTRSGFLGDAEDYDRLEPAKERQVWGVPDEILLDRRPALDERIAAGSITGVVVDPVVILEADDGSYDLSEEHQVSFAAKSTRRLAKELGKGFPILSEPEPGAVRVRLAVTDVNPSNVWVNIVGVILVVPPDMGGISGELAVEDAMTGERLAAMTLTREGTPFLVLECFTRHGHAHHGVLKWSRDVRRLLQGD